MATLTDRQRQIVDRAIELIGSHGLSALTMRRLSEALGVTEPALYRHFENKSAILDAMLLVLEAETYDKLPLEEDATPKALVSHFERLFALIVERPALATVVLADELAAGDEQILVRVRQLLAKNRSRLVGVLRTLARQSARNVDAESLATLLLGGVRLLVREWQLDGCSWDLVGRGRRLVGALTKQIAKNDG